MQNGVACGQHWTDYITFRYDRSRRAFVFHKRVIEAWEMNTQDTRSAQAGTAVCLHACAMMTPLRDQLPAGHQLSMLRR
ncbi:hypothetical protein A11M_0101295 [Xanthomonas vasicola pv. vasculorum NCPPB 895]|nr:hypothetical protein A11M_0101295 [Xanthomonas vasicola pv. vasculorum NCPPB 895]KFA24876.1 hypothetical protein KW5_0117840 [Xanthomonas vasicola pv. vasculorum NCPPB 1326]KFA29200.1 hypothetical protein KWG_0116020 [Xanthomonas vasicola pv. vasculorum NCPPB 1381]